MLVGNSWDSMWLIFLPLSAIEVIQFVKSKRSKRTGLPIEIRFSSEDSFRSDLVDLLMLYSAVSKVGVNRVGIADTVGWWVASPSFLYTLRALTTSSLRQLFSSPQVILTANQSLNPALLHDRYTILWEHSEESLIAVWFHGIVGELKLIGVYRYRDPFVSLTNILFGVLTSSPQPLRLSYSACAKTKILVNDVLCISRWCLREKR